MSVNRMKNDFQCACGEHFDGYNCEGCGFVNSTGQDFPNVGDEHRFNDQREENVVSVGRILSYQDGLEGRMTFDITDPWNSFSVTIEYEITLDTSRASSGDNTIIIEKIGYDCVEGTPLSHQRILEDSGFDIKGAIANAFDKD